MKRAFLLALMIVLAAGLILSGCGGAATEEPIRIGAIVHLTGANSILGPPIVNGLEYRLELVGGEVAGRQIELIAEDDATDPVVGLDKAKKLLQIDKVDVIFSPVNSMVAMSVASHMATTNTPYIGLMPKPLDMPKMGNNIFAPLGTNEGTGYRAGLYAYDVLGYRTCTSLCADYISGYEFVEQGAIEAFEDRGGTCIQKQRVKLGTTDFSPYLAALKPADCCIFWSIPADAQRFAKQYYDAGLKAPLVIANATVLFPKALGELGDDCVGMVGCSFYTSLIDNPMNKSYVEGFVNKYGFIVYESLGADVALTMYLEAVKATNGDTSPEKINEALSRVKVDTPCGTYSFNPDGLGIGNLYLVRVVKMGEMYDWEVIDTYSQEVLDKPR